MSVTKADFILLNASRVITVAIRCMWSFGAADGLNEILGTADDPDGVWRQPVSVLQRDAALIAALRAVVLLENEANAVSFQAIYHGLNEPTVRGALLQELETRHGPDICPPSRQELIEDFLRTYLAIDWNVYGRLKHLRNLGIAHLKLDPQEKSITFPELRIIVGIVGRLASTLQQLLRIEMAAHDEMAEECRDQVKSVIKVTRCP